ncbi:MAG: endo-1,4-beta-xylanase [Fibrobacteria bacterium]|nr:endo-1,4-beta-xylanase [Fibrobacteria bacterium]
MRSSPRASIPLVALALAGLSVPAQAQIAKGASKFLGNITSQNQVRSDFGTYWNQITGENECKWQVVEGSRDNMNWSGCDAAYKYAKSNGFPFRFHTLIWGSQYPSWLGNLSTADQKAEIEEWMDEAAKRYPDADMIDVVNESVSGHAPFPYTAPLGGAGSTGHDWVIQSFKMARQRWPNAKLVLNDYNNFRWNVDDFIAIAKKVKAAGGGIIDAIGCQAHDLSATTGQYTNPEMKASDLSAVLKKLHDQVGLPIYVTELDLSYSDDTQQLNAYKALFPIMWESEYVAGVTIWGYIYGQTWDQAQYSGLIKNGSERPALAWLKSYVASNMNPPNPLPLKPVSTAPRFSGSETRSGSRIQLAVDMGRMDVVFERDGRPVNTSILGRR